VADHERDTPEPTTETTEGTETVTTEIVNTDTANAATSATVDTATLDTEAAHSPGTDRIAAEPLTAPGTVRPDLAFSGYTSGYADVAGVDPAPVARRRGPDPLALVVGLATLAMAVFAFVGELPDLSGVDPRWVLAGGAALVGLALLVSSLRGRSGRRS
jgi:hypothetical protein